MRVLILAAGEGRRLSPLTDRVPKCLLSMGAASPLSLLFEALAREPRVSEVVLVVGHAREKIDAYLTARRDPFRVRTIFNPRYRQANNIYSAHLAREACAGGFLLLNSDVVLHPAILRDALAEPCDSFLVVDPATPPRPEAMKVRYRDGRLAAIGKDLDPATASGEYIGVAGFDAAVARSFFRAVRRILDRGGDHHWYEEAIGQSALEVPFRERSTGGRPWIEIDDADDLRRAEREVLPAIWRPVRFRTFD